MRKIKRIQLKGRRKNNLSFCMNERTEKLERLVLSYSPKFQAILNSAKPRIKEGYGIGHEEFWKDMAY